MRLGAEVAPVEERDKTEKKMTYVGLPSAEKLPRTTDCSPMIPKMSRMEGTKMTSRLTTKMRQNAMPMCTDQRKGLSGKRICSSALRICSEKVISRLY